MIPRKNASRPTGSASTIRLAAIKTPAAIRLNLPICEELEEEDNQCRVCVNDKPGGLQDSGCNEGCKICAGLEVGESGELLDIELNLGDFGDICKVCLDDLPSGGQDSGCPEGLPICAVDPAAEGFEATFTFGDGCAKCIDDSNGVDSGCDAQNPVCVTAGSQSPYGFECVPCMNNRLNLVTDDGCSANARFCNGPFGESGIGCFKCQNNRNGVDRGCKEGYPHCVAAPGDYGIECAYCINNDESDGIDTGCDSDSPFCIADFCQGGSFCAPCINDSAFGTDSGCISIAPNCNGAFGGPGTQCGTINPIDPCNPNPCMEGEVCVPGTGGTFMCVNDPCDPDPCTTGEVCIPASDGTYMCVDDPCDPDPCDEGEECDPLTGMCRDERICDGNKGIGICLDINNCGNNCINVCNEFCVCGSPLTTVSPNKCQNAGGGNCSGGGPCCQCKCEDVGCAFPL